MILPWLYPISIGIPAKYELIENPSISHLFEFFLVPGKISHTIAKPVAHTESAPQPIVKRRSSSDRPIGSPIVVVIASIKPIIPIITIALRAVSDSGKLNILLPTMDEERTVPVISMSIPLLSASFFFPAIILLLAPISTFSLLPILSRPSVSYHNTRSGRPSRASFFLD